MGVKRGWGEGCITQLGASGFENLLKYSIWSSFHGPNFSEYPWVLALTSLAADYENFSKPNKGLLKGGRREGYSKGDTILASR